MQSTDTIFMIRPASFRMNEQTAINNHYQVSAEGLPVTEIGRMAIEEFDSLVALLRNHDIKVIVAADSFLPEKPDSLFPNNWISFHENDQVVLYPMFAENRRLERRMDILPLIFPEEKNTITDLTSFEQDDKFLEGTGSLVLDRENMIAFAALSARTDKSLVEFWCEKMNYRPVIFNAYQSVNGKRESIYHTNVMMCIGTSFAALCEDCIDHEEERKAVRNAITSHDKEIILITEDQVNHFAGNMLEVRNTQGEIFIVMSSSAYHSLDVNQRERLQHFGKIVHTPLHTIETHGGGSARCMLAEVFV